MPDDGRPQIPDEAVQAYVLGYANAPADVRHPDRVRAGLAAAYPILALFRHHDDVAPPRVDPGGTGLTKGRSSDG